MASGLSKFHGLDFRPRNPRGLREHHARNASPALTHAFAKLAPRADILFRKGRAVRNSLVGYLEGQVLGQMVGRRCKFHLSSGVSQAVYYSSATGLGSLRKLTDCRGSRSGCFLVARQTGSGRRFWLTWQDAVRRRGTSRKKEKGRLLAPFFSRER